MLGQFVLFGPEVCERVFVTEGVEGDFVAAGRYQEVVIVHALYRRYCAGIWRQRPDKATRMHVKYQCSCVLTAHYCTLPVHR